MARVDAAFKWQFGNAELDEAGRELRVAGEPVDLEPRPLEILLALLRHAGEVVTKDDLLDAVYGHRYLTDGAVAQGVRRLRRALGDEDQTVIATVHRVGYKLIAKVSRTEISGPRLRPLLLKAGDPVPRRDHWRLLQPLGSAEIEVWLIEHEKTHARRVLKMATDTARLSTLKREVTLCRVLKDALGEREDFVTLIDWNFDASPFFTECAYGGITLVEWAEALGGLSAMSLDLRVDMVAWAAAAVGAAHGANVLHKDLKPTNILAYTSPDDSWRARLIDFGSGRILDAERVAALRITQHGFTQEVSIGEDSLGGTPFYWAPEVLAGQMPTVQSDVYALGVILYQVVVGDFRRPIAPGWEDDVVDPWLRECITAATHGNPAKRLPSAEDLVQRLRSLEGRRLAHVPPPVRSAGRGRWLAWATLVAVVIAIAALTIEVPRRPPEMPLSAVAGREAIDDYQQVVTISHQRNESMVDRQEAIKTLERVVGSNPRFANAWALLAQENAHIYFNHYETEKSRAAATRALQKAMELQPNAPDTLIARGYYSYWIEGDYVAAAATMLHVHKTWPDKRDATIALARISRRQGRYAAAARYFEEALAQDPFNFEVALGAADARLVLGDYSAALKLTNHALDIEPHDIQSISLKWRVYEEQGDLASAAAVLPTLPNRPGDFTAANLLAEQQRLSRNFPASIEIWKAYLANPESKASDDINVAKAEVGHLSLLTGDTQAAIPILKQVRDELEKQRGNRPGDPILVGDLALVYADLGEPALARTLAQAATNFEVVRNDADRSTIFNVIRASVAVRTGDNDEAFRILRQVLKRPSRGAVTPGLLSIDPEWDRLRTDPRFTDLSERAPRLGVPTVLHQ